MKNAKNAVISGEKGATLHMRARPQTRDENK